LTETYEVAKDGVIESLAMIGLMANELYGPTVANALFTLSTRSFFPKINVDDNPELVAEIESRVHDAMFDTEIAAMCMTDEQREALTKLVTDE